VKKKTFQGSETSDHNVSHKTTPQVRN